MGPTDGDGRIGVAQPSSQTPSSRASESALDIPGIDVRAGLKRTGGNRKRYESLLRKFAEQQANVVEAARAALAAGDAATAERAAHSLKGAAGTLGAVALAEVAARAETLIKTEQPKEPALKKLSLALDQLVGAIPPRFPKKRGATAREGVWTIPLWSRNPSLASRSCWKATTAKPPTSSSIPDLASPAC